MQMRPQFGERHGCTYRNAVTHHVEIGLPKVDDPIPCTIRDPRVTDIPLARHGPIEHGRPGWHLRYRQRQVCIHAAKRFANTIARNAAADGIQLRNQTVQGCPAHRAARHCFHLRLQRIHDSMLTDGRTKSG